MQKIEVKKILIPNKPHLDPIAALYILGQYGAEKFEGVKSANILFWEHSHSPTDEDIARFREDKTLLLDVGGGEFDHHGNENGENETTTSLVARYLGVEKNPELMTLLNYIREDDLEGLHNRFGELASLLKCMYKQNTPQNEVVSLGLHILNIFQSGQMDWHHNVRKEFDEKCRIVKIKRNKKKLKIGIIESDNVQVANYGITANNMSVIIQKRSTGHVMILTNKHHRIYLKEIIGAIRKKELEVRGYDKEIDPKKLQFEGKSQLVPIWFYHRSLNSMLNGSDALSRTEPTRIPFKDIIRFVMYGISTEESEHCDCDKGGKNCPYKDYGFSRCGR